MAFIRSLALAGRIGGLATRVQPFQPYKSHLLLSRCVTIKASPAPPPSSETFEEKNEGVRPMSPHLLIYKPQLTSMMSISHRMAGLALTGYATVLSFLALSGYDIPELVEDISCCGIPNFLMFPLKCILAFPVFYHLFNGIRHLTWDLGKGFKIIEIYLTGYLVLAATIIFTLITSL